MIDWITYAFMQHIGYRKYYYDIAFARSIRLDRYDSWEFKPWIEKGTYRETISGYKFVGYGVDK